MPLVQWQTGLMALVLSPQYLACKRFNVFTFVFLSVKKVHSASLLCWLSYVALSGKTAGKRL